ncbi:MAG: SDR family NAD(P)-dependent oxidoreductase [Lachnospiraceae bacterium]|nr:SDR family NAD(P)-dependent oxidoreductase [Lachnospiraceae bacterium]
METILADVSIEEDRLRLFETVKGSCPELNVLINNAGIQQRLDLSEMDWEVWKKEIATNLEAPIHLCGLFAPFLEGKENAQIINVGSGLAFRPPVHVPVYGATKAGIHSFTFALREQLWEKGITVMEIIPPAVNTNLGGAGVHAAGVDLDEFADSVYRDILDRKDEIVYGFSAMTADRTRREMETDARRGTKRSQSLENGN